MCYSAQIRQDFSRFTREYGAVIDIAEFVRLYWERSEGSKAKIPKSLDAAFAEPKTVDERRIKTLIDDWNTEQAAKLQQEVFKQRKRLADAERTLQAKTTKAASESKRIATAKVEWALGKLSALRRTTLVDTDARIFPGWFAPVIVSEGGRRVVKPMRYQCRLPGKPAFYDTKFPGTYNARRDNLEGFWKDGASRAGAWREGRERGPGVPAAAAAGHAGCVPVVALDRRGRAGALVLRGDHRRAAGGDRGGGA